MQLHIPFNEFHRRRPLFRHTYNFIRSFPAILIRINLLFLFNDDLISRIESGDLALVSREHSRQGTLLFYEPLVGVGSPQFETWKSSPLQIAVYEDTSLAKRNAIQSLALQGKMYRVVYNSSSLAGQIAAVERGLAVAVFTRCSVSPHLKILGAEHGLGPLKPMQVSIYRSPKSVESKAVSYLQDLLISTLRESIV